MNPITWAFHQPVPTSEKLVLVYLASQANPAGVGLWDRDALQRATDHKPRSIQRLLKSLRDAGLLTDCGGWYLLACAPREILGELDDLEPIQVKPDAQTTPENSVSDDAIDAMGNRMIDAGDYLIDQLQAFESRLEHQLQQFVLAAGRIQVEREPEPPPPDPVLESEVYNQLLGLGFHPENAYGLAKQRLDEDALADLPTAGAEALPRAVEQLAGRHYDDTPMGRLERVRDVLAGDGAPDVLEASIVDQWERLEADEDKHTVDGESVTGFELLYPAIVDAARRNPGMSLEQFLDPEAIKHCRAPWDQDPEPTAAEDATLEAEVATMLAEIEAANHKQCQVQPRIVQKNDGGGTSIETIVGYHRRVSQVYRQLQRLKAMGAA